MRVRFGDFVFDSGRRELRSGSTPLHLTPKAYLLLEALLEARPRPVSKESLYQHLWPHTFVVDTNLKMLVSVLRIVLGEDARHPQWIRTVYGFGYAFHPDGVVELPQPDADQASGMIFRLLLGREMFLLNPGTNILGREADAEVMIDSTSVSRHHAMIVVSAGDALIEDLGSKNGTFIGNRRVEAPAGLKDGDKIRLGTVTLAFSAQPRSASTVTHAPV